MRYFKKTIIASVAILSVVTAYQAQQIYTAKQWNMINFIGPVKAKTANAQTANAQTVNAQTVNAQTVNAQALQSKANSQPASIVIVKNVTSKLINDRLNAIGTGRANATVELTPWSSGVMDALYVQAGTKVNIGDKIAKLDSDNEEIAVEKAKIQLADAESALIRTNKLRATNTATEVQAINARLALDNAKLALRDAQLALDRRTILSPISGIVGILPVDVGNYVTSSTTIARVDNRDRILVDIFVPEAFAPLVHIGDNISASSTARPQEIYQGKISAIDNMIDEASRTLRVRAEINNEEDKLRAGMSFAVSLRFPGDPFPSVDPLSIQWSGEGAYVWRVKSNVAEKVNVAIIQRNTNSVLVKGDLAVDDIIVTQGVQNLNQGSQVVIKSNDSAQNLTKIKQQQTSR